MCTRYKLQMHLYTACTIWTALRSLVRKKKTPQEFEVHLNLLENSIQIVEKNKKAACNEIQSLIPH